MDNLKLFQNHSQYTQDKDNLTLPNVSYCINENEVHYGPIETKLVIVYNVTSTTNPTKIMANSSIATAFTEIEIDGVKQNTVTETYTFNTTGEHTVKYTLANNTTIKANAFYDCPNLARVTIPDSVTNVETYAFNYCQNLTDVKFSKNITSIGSEAFYYCINLNTPTLPEELITIGSGAFRNCKKIQEIVIPNKVTTISANAFYDCTQVQTVTIPSSVTLIGSTAFSYSSNLQTVNYNAQYQLMQGMHSWNPVVLNIGDAVTSIGQRALINCNKLTTLTIGSGLTEIESQAFYGCSNMSNITCHATTAPTIANNSFEGVKTNGTLTVNPGSTGYNTWMSTNQYYLGYYNWTKIEE